MIKNTVLTALTGFAMIMISSVALTQEAPADNDSGIGARAMGMGGANIAAANDLSAVIYNPAALARLNKLEIQLGVNMLKKNVESLLNSKDNPGSKLSTTSDFLRLGSIGIAYPMPTDRGSLVFAVAYNRAKDFEGRYKLDGFIDDVDLGNGEFTPGGYNKIDKVEEGGLGILSLAGAVDVSPNVSFGAAFDIWMGSYRRNNRDLLNDYREQYKYSELYITDLDNDISAWSFKPSILYHNKYYSLGAFIRFPMTFHIDHNYFEEWDIDETDPDFYFGLYDTLDPEYDTYNSYSENFSYKIKAPMQLGFGLSFGKPGKTVLGLDLTYENWKQAKYEYPSYIQYEPSYFEDTYRSAVSWRVGIEQPIPTLGLAVRAGYLKNPLIFKGPRDNDSPVITIDNERDFLTFGLGKQFDESLSIDAALAYGVWSEKEGNVEDEESRTRLFVSVTYRIPTLQWR